MNINFGTVGKIFSQCMMVGLVGTIAVMAFAPEVTASRLFLVFIPLTLGLVALVYPIANDPKPDTWAGKVRSAYEFFQLPRVWYTRYAWLAFTVGFFVLMMLISKVVFISAAEEFEIRGMKWWEGSALLALSMSVLVFGPLVYSAYRNEPGVFASQLEPGKRYLVRLLGKYRLGEYISNQGYEACFWVRFVVHRSELIDRVSLTDGDMNSVSIKAAHLEGMTDQDKLDQIFLVKASRLEQLMGRFYGFDENHDAIFILFKRIPLRDVKWQVKEREVVSTG